MVIIGGYPNDLKKKTIKTKVYSIKHALHINASEQKVYEKLSTIKGLQNWWTIYTSGSSALNGIITFEFPPHFMNRMQVIALEENHLIKWKCLEGEADWIGTEFLFELDQNERKTRLYFEHSKWPTSEDFYAHCTFSWGRYLESLRQLCETGSGEPFKNP